MFIIKILLIILLAGLFLFLFLLLGMVGMVNRIRKQFTGKKEQQSPFNNKTTRDGQVITDTRDPQTANRKIIADDEGEYVEYEED